jgi:hypothetical protein
MRGFPPHPPSMTEIDAEGQSLNRPRRREGLLCELRANHHEKREPARTDAAKAA